MAPKKVTSFGEMRLDVLLCRAGRRHPFKFTMSVVTPVERRTGLTYHWDCTQCNTRRLDVVVPNHRQKKIERVSRTYIHGDNYLIENVDDWGGRLVFNDNVQYELFVRMMKTAKGVKK